MTVNQRHGLTGMLASIIGGLPFNTLPILPGSLADSVGFEPARIFSTPVARWCWRQ